MKDHLFIQSLEKDGQELLRGESAIGAAQWVGQQELELARTRALAPSKRKREVREGGSEETSEREREGERLGAKNYLQWKERACQHQEAYQYGFFKRGEGVGSQTFPGGGRALVFRLI